MNMLKQALVLWRNENCKNEITLKRRLMLFFLCITVSLVLLFALLLVSVGINGREEKVVESYIDNELDNISQKMKADFVELSLEGLALAEDISVKCDRFFSENDMDSTELSQYPFLLEDLLDGQMEILLNVTDNHYCGGAFILLDATVNPEAEDAKNRKAGIFIKKTQPTSTSTLGVKRHYLRGPANIARKYGIGLLAQWSMEYDIEGEEFFLNIMETARKNTELPLSRLYYWTGRVELSGNSETGFLLCVPLRSEDGGVYGVCGIEVSDRMFKSLYSPNASAYENVFTVAAPAGENCLKTSQGIIAGNYYLTGHRMTEDLCKEGESRFFEKFVSGDTYYGGKTRALCLYSAGSPYEKEDWEVAVLMPENLLKTAMQGNSRYFFLILLVLLVAAFSVSVWISRRYITPVTETLRSMEQQIQDVRDEYEKAQMEIDVLADRKKQEIDPESYAIFIESIKTLTPKEKEIFYLYKEGKQTREVLELLSINQNTLKYHNKNLYSKLGVSSRKQLLAYAAVMKREG